MATVATTLEPEAHSQPFTRPPDSLTRGTSIARGELRYYVNSGTWTAPGAGNDKRLNIDMSLPKDFAYLCTDMSLQIRNSYYYLTANNLADIEFNADPGTAGTAPDYRTLRADNWSGSNAFDADGSDYLLRDVNTIKTSAGTDGNTRKNYVPTSLPSYLLFPFTDTRYQSTVSIQLEDITPNSPAYTVYFFVRFVQYDISQVYNWAPNSPVI